MKKPAKNKHTMGKRWLPSGLGVHAQYLALALAEGRGRRSAHLWDDPPTICMPWGELRVCYEAGPTGFVLARRLEEEFIEGGFR
jgi:hypothetical protein